MNWVGENGLWLFVIREVALERPRFICNAKSKSCRDGGRNVICLGFVSQLWLWNCGLP